MGALVFEKKDLLSNFTEKTKGGGYSLDTIVPYFSMDSHGWVNAGGSSCTLFVNGKDVWSPTSLCG